MSEVAAGGLATTEVLEDGLSRVMGRPVRIAATQERPLGTTSTHPISRLTVTLTDGVRLRVVFKRLAARPDRRPGREVLVYRRLLAGGNLDAPVLYASQLNPDPNRCWLFLEDVGRWRLDWWGRDGWELAVRWMARMHAQYTGREEELEALGCLEDHGADHYREMAGAARTSLALRGSPETLDRLDALTDRWLTASVPDLTAAPRTLVHASMQGNNVIVQPGRGQARRVRPLDWETAAIGVAAVDVDKLLSGWGPVKPCLLDAYAQEYDRHADVPLDRVALDRALTHCEILRALRTLFWWKEPCGDPHGLDLLLDGMESAWHRLTRGRRHG